MGAIGGCGLRVTGCSGLEGRGATSECKSAVALCHHLHRASWEEELLIGHLPDQRVAQARPALLGQLNLGPQICVRRNHFRWGDMPTIVARINALVGAASACKNRRLLGTPRVQELMVPQGHRCLTHALQRILYVLLAQALEQTVRVHQLRTKNTRAHEGRHTEGRNGQATS